MGRWVSQSHSSLLNYLGDFEAALKPSGKLQMHFVGQGGVLPPASRLRPLLGKNT